MIDGGNHDAHRPHGPQRFVQTGKGPRVKLRGDFLGALRPQVVNAEQFRPRDLLQSPRMLLSVLAHTQNRDWNFSSM